MIADLMRTKTSGFPAAIVAGVLGFTACGPAPPPFKPVTDVKGLMQGVVDPAADGVWQSVAVIFTKGNVEERRPHTDQEWATVRGQAMTLAEAGNLLMIAPRAKDGGDWMKFAQDLVDTSAAALRATEAKDADRLLDVGGTIDDACERCHKKYWPNY
jgi:hypothetical protein